MIKMTIILMLIILITPILKSFISDYDKCYSEMENDGIAVFGCCHGIAYGTQNIGYLSKKCIHCPYYTSVNSLKEDIKND